MIDKVNELQNSPKDPNSPESQEFLKNLHERSVERQATMKKMIEGWREEERQNATK